MKDSDYRQWNEKSRKVAVFYLINEGVTNPSVGDWPSFDVAPHFGIWCVESQQIQGRIGWWVFVGDCPTDYVPEQGNVGHSGIFCKPSPCYGLLSEKILSPFPFERHPRQFR